MKNLTNLLKSKEVTNVLGAVILSIIPILIALLVITTKL